MRNKLEYLRAQTAAYLRDADASYNEREAAHLVMLAMRCREQIDVLEAQSRSKRPADLTP